MIDSVYVSNFGIKSMKINKLSTYKWGQKKWILLEYLNRWMDKNYYQNLNCFNMFLLLLLLPFKSADDPNNECVCEWIKFLLLFRMKMNYVDNDDDGANK